MHKEWKLGDDLHTSDAILSGITFDDLILVLQNERAFQDKTNHNTAYMKKCFRQILNGSMMQDAMHFIENNVTEILREVFPDNEEYQEQKPKLLSDEACEELAWKIHKLLLENELWQDVRIYFNCKALSTSDRKGEHFHYNGEPLVLEDIDPKDFFDYVHATNIISMSFEGPVYEMFNYGEFESVHEKFIKLVGDYGLYYELGNAWNLTLCEN